MSLTATIVVAEETRLTTRCRHTRRGAIASLRITDGSTYGPGLDIIVSDARLDAAAWLDALADECTELAAKVRDLRPTERAA